MNINRLLSIANIDVENHEPNPNTNVPCPLNGKCVPTFIGDLNINRSPAALFPTPEDVTNTSELEPNFNIAHNGHSHQFIDDPEQPTPSGAIEPKTATFANKTNNNTIGLPGVPSDCVITSDRVGDGPDPSPALVPAPDTTAGAASLICASSESSAEPSAYSGEASVMAARTSSRGDLRRDDLRAWLVCATGFLNFALGIYCTTIATG